MIKWIIIAVVVILAVIGAMFLWGSFDEPTQASDTSELAEEESPLDNVPDSEFSDLTEDDAVFDEIDEALDALG